MTEIPKISVVTQIPPKARWLVVENIWHFDKEYIKLIYQPKQDKCLQEIQPNIFAYVRCNVISRIQFCNSTMA